jgi:hypothetical protein
MFRFDNYRPSCRNVIETERGGTHLDSLLLGRLRQKNHLFRASLSNAGFKPGLKKGSRGGEGERGGKTGQ